MSKSKKAARVCRDVQGRAHLLVHRDGVGNIRRIALSQPIFHDDWQNEVATATANTVNEIFGGGRTMENAVALGRNAMQGASTIVDGALRPSSGQSPACRAGCSHCCHQAVGVTAPEALAIYDYLEATLDADELAATANRIRAADQKTRGMSSAERHSPELPCPFLIEDRCSIYEVRPVACRGANSLDAEACARTLRDPGARARFLEGKLSVPCFLEPIRAVHAVTAGLQLGLHELQRLAALPLELSAAMRILVDDPEGAPRRWLAGEDPFFAARGGDQTGNAQLAKLSGRRAGV